MRAGSQVSWLSALRKSALTPFHKSQSNCSVEPFFKVNPSPRNEKLGLVTGIVFQ